MKTNENLIAKVYEKSIDQDVKKSMGKYYTPEFIINYINCSTNINSAFNSEQQQRILLNKYFINILVKTLNFWLCNRNSRNFLKKS